MFISCDQCKETKTLDHYKPKGEHSFETVCDACKKRNKAYSKRGSVKECDRCKEISVINNFLDFDDVCKKCRNIEKNNLHKTCQEKYKNHYVCFTCGDLLHIDNFYVAKGYNYPRDNKCKNCISISQRAKKYNITVKEVKDLLSKNKCSICEKEFISNSEKHIDHCHKTNKVRDVLCSKCNKTLGLINEDVEIIYKLYEYISKHL